MIENSHRKGQMLRVASEEKFLLSPKGSIGAIYVKNGRTNISVIKNARCARVTAWGRPRNTEDKRNRSMPSHSVLENNHYKLQPLRITTSIFKITKMSLEKGAVSCPRSKLLRRRPKAGIPQYSTSCAVRSPWNTLKTQVITVPRLPGSRSIKHWKPHLWNLTTQEQKQLRPNSTAPKWKRLLFLQPWMREKRTPQKIPWPAPGDRTTDANEHSPQVNSTGKANYSICTKEQIPLNSSSRSGWDTHPSKRHLGIRGGCLRWTAGSPGYSIGSKSCKRTEWSYIIKINKCTTYNVNKSLPYIRDTEKVNISNFPCSVVLPNRRPEWGWGGRTRFHSWRMWKSRIQW